MKKQIMAVLATIAAVLGFGFTAVTAQAADTYAPTIITTGVSYDPATGILTVPVDADGAVEAGYTHVYAGYDRAQVSDVVLAASINTYKYLGTVDHDQFKLSLQITDAMRATAGTVEIQVFMAKEKLANAADIATYEDKLVVTADGSTVLDYNIPATGEGDQGNGSTGDKVAQTGAALMPYVTAVILLAAAAIALVAVRMTGERSRR